MIHSAFQHRVRMLSAMAAVGMVTLTGCGADDSPTRAVASTSVAELEELTSGTLYEAITYARENDLSYTVQDSSGGAVEVDDTRKFTVIEQEPASGTPIQPRNSLTLVVKPND